MELLHSALLGIIQGITEFLPISSSAHLVLVPYVFKWDYQGLYFDVALHFGTVLAIVCYFFKDWIEIIKLGAKSIVTSESKDPSLDSVPTTLNYPPNLLWQILIASIPAAIIGFLINDYVEKYLHSPVLLSANLIIFGLLLYLADKFSLKQLSLNKIKYGGSFLIGIAQSLALIPGISRSGITMIASRFMGLNRESSARFSFLIGAPAMVGAFILEIAKVPLSDLKLPFFLGTLSAFIAGLLAIKFLLNYLRHSNFSIFFWYRFALATVIIILFFTR